LTGKRQLPGAAARKQGFGAPLRARVNHLPLGPTLFHSLVASLVPPVSLSLLDPEAADLAEWEADLADPAGSRPAATGIVSLLTAQAQHAILLVPAPAADGRTVVDKVYSSWRYRSNKSPDQSGSDPYLAYQTKIEKGQARQVPKMSLLDSPVPDAWRSLPSLIPTAGGRVDARHAPPAVVSELSTLPAGQGASWIKVTVCAWSQEAGRQRDGDWDRSDTPDIHVALWTTPGEHDPQPEKWRAGIDTWVRACEDEFTLLQHRLRRARHQALNLDPTDKSAGVWASTVVHDFWAAAHDLFDAALENAANAEEYAASAARARGEVRRITSRLYERATDGQMNSRTARHIIRNRPSLVVHDGETTAEPDEEQAAS
jgi:hypothetical protein